MSYRVATKGSWMSQYGEDWAEIYDELYGGRDDLDTFVDFVRRRTDPAMVLEFGVGTGRLAIPLAQAGLKVHGVDNSPAMLKAMAAKPGGELVQAHLGDIADPPVKDQFGCVLIAFSTLYLLSDQRTQIRCVGAAAKRLAPTGVLVVEGFIPDPTRWHDGQSLGVHRWDDDEVAVTLGRINPAAQVIETVRIQVASGGRPRLVPNRLRFVLPAELDLIAAQHGLRLDERYEDYGSSPLTQSSHSFVAVYRHAGDARDRTTG
jgi:SAM-dependent methyltransferase